MPQFDDVVVFTFDAATFTVEANVQYASYRAAQDAAKKWRDEAEMRATHPPG